MKTVLLVDDSPAVRLLSRRILKAAELNVVEAEHGAQALDLLRGGLVPDVVLLDWNMPVLTGIEFLRALRAETALPQPRVVMCTTEGGVDHIVEALAAGADEYVMKPFTPEILRQKLEEVGAL